MAFKSFSNLTSRNQSTLVTQIHKLINYYGSTFCTRPRLHLKALSKFNNAIYWLEDNEKKLTSLALVDPNYRFDYKGVSIVTLGHTVSRRQGQMERIINHVLSDFVDEVVMLICKPFVGESLGVEENFKMVPVSPTELIEYAPELATLRTDYFNAHNETFAGGLGRKNHHVYIRIPESKRAYFQNSKDPFWNFLLSKEKEIENLSRLEELSKSELSN